MEESTTVNGTLSSVTQYSYGHDLISQRRWKDGQWTTHFFGYDGHGSVRFLTDKDGNVTDTLDYDAFGILVDRTGNTPLNYMYAGEQWDSDLGMYYNRARYLNVNTGRFWTQDSWEGSKFEPKTLHKYVYSSSSPINYIDPSGHSFIELNVRTIIKGILTVASTYIGLINSATEAHAPTLTPRYGPAQAEVDANETLLILDILFAAASLALSLTRVGIKPAYKAAVRGSGQEIGDSPYQIPYDPKIPGRPDPQWSIDTANYTVGAGEGVTSRGIPRNRPQFWQDWLNLRPETISNSNRGRIQYMQTNPRIAGPQVDDTWIQYFPHHAPARGHGLNVHHIDGDRYCIPVPQPYHLPNATNGLPFHHGMPGMPNQ